MKMHIIVKGADVILEGNETELLGILQGLINSKPNSFGVEVLQRTAVEERDQQQTELQQITELEKQLKNAEERLAKNAIVDIFPKVAEFTKFIEEHPDKMLMPMGYFLRMMGAPKPTNNNEWSRVNMRLVRARENFKKNRTSNTH
jgi:hypothetical protein